MRTTLIIAAIVLAACSIPQPLLVAVDIEITKPMPGRSMSAGYMDLMSNTARAITITHVTSPQFGSVEIHETTTEDGVARMRKLDNLVVDPMTTVTLERGGKHLMLMKAKDLKSSVTLNFYSGDELILTVDYKFPAE